MGEEARRKHREQTADVMVRRRTFTPGLTALGYTASSKNVMNRLQPLVSIASCGTASWRCNTSSARASSAPGGALNPKP